MVSPLRRVPFYKRLKRNQKRLPLRTAFAALRFPRSGVHQGASTPVGFASTSIRCPRLRRGALRAIPLMNTSTRPPDGAGRSKARSKAKAKAGRDLLVGAEPCSRCRACEAAIDPEGGAKFGDRWRTFGPIAACGSGYREGVCSDCFVWRVRFFSLICRAFPRESPGYISVVLASCAC